MNKLFEAIAKLAGKSTSDVTEATAVDVLGSVASRIEALTTERDAAKNEAKKLSADVPEKPDDKTLARKAKLARQILDVEMKAGTVSKDQAEKLFGRFVADDKGAYVLAFARDEDAPDAALEQLEAVLEVMKSGKGTKSDGKAQTQVQALSRDEDKPEEASKTIQEVVTKTLHGLYGVKTAK